MDEQSARETRVALEFAESIGTIATFSLDVETETTEVTPALRAFWGIPDGVSHVSLDSFLNLIHADDRDRVAEAREMALRTGQPYHIEYRIVRRDGTVRHLRTDGQFFYDADGRAVRNVGAVLDFTDQRNAQRTIAHLLDHDKLTGLRNREAFIARVGESARAAADGESFTIVVFDLDGFNAVNHTFGVPAGDAVLRAVAERLRGIARDREYYGRTGGDDFAGLLRPENGDANGAVARIVSALEPPISIGTETIAVTATFGVSVFPFDAKDEGLVAQAGLALSSLKSRGLRGSQRYGTEMHRVLAEQNRLRSDLRRAFDLEHFELEYQPIVDARTLRICSCEALVRWNHPDLGAVPPNAFLPAAREMGLMRELDAWVLRRACGDFAEMHRRAGGTPRFGVNVSAQFLLAPEFKDAVDEALRSTGIPASALVLEITEQSLLAEQPQTLATLSWLRRIGVTIAIDDFGTGYNTLSYLKLYPIDVIKIDRSFVSDIESYPYSRSVCSGILALASELGLRVVAEGVETKAQEAFLTSLGCARLQGFLYGKPMPLEEFVRVICEQAAQRAS
ncbi:MAG TPA: EAL domain-containing protein [Candidatus Tyrphobacter sp.]